MKHRLVLSAIAIVAVACGARSGLDAPLPAPAPSSGTTSGTDAAVAPQGRTLSAGWQHTCAITRSKTVVCWGQSIVNGSSPIGNAPVPVSGLDDVVEIAAGETLDCARKSDGTVVCWGYATAGAILPVRGARFDTIVSGMSTACGISGGRVACVGGAFLTGGVCASDVAGWDGSATFVPGLSGIAGLAVGSFHACAFGDAGGTWCWGCSAGDESHLVYTLGSNVPSTDTPVVVSAAAQTRRLAAGTASTCATQADGKTICWGDRSQFGRGITVHPAAPAVAELPPSPIDLGVGVTFTCAAYADAITCVGGQPTYADGCNDRRDDPQSFSVPGVRELAVGYEHVCARDAGGAVWCWGCNTTGEVGDGTRTPRASPVRVLD